MIKNLVIIEKYSYDLKINPSSLTSSSSCAILREEDLDTNLEFQNLEQKFKI